MGALNDILDHIYTRSRCQKLIKYQGRVFEFSDLDVEVPPVKISLGGFSTEVKTIETAGETAKALDDFQYLLCRNLENKTLKEQLDRDTWTKYIKTLLAANALVLGFRQTLEAFRIDPANQGQNLDNITKHIQNLVKSLSGEIDQNYNTQDGRNAITSAITAAKIVEGSPVDEHEIDMLLSSKFKEFEDTQSKILQKITDVEQTFRDNQNKLSLLQSNIEIYTSETKINPGKSDCWITGYFTNREIKSGYDARRPITDEIIKSIENNFGTIIYGDPFTGKSILLKRIMFELIQKGYVVLYADNIEAPPNLIEELVCNVAKIYDKIVFIVDNVHKKSSEVAFRVFNEIEPGKVKFLFAGREKLLDKKRPETRVALSDIALAAQYRIDFNIDFAILLFTKAINVTLKTYPTARDIVYGNSLYDYSKDDPLMFNIILTLFLELILASGGQEIEMEKIEQIDPSYYTIESYMTSEIDQIEEKIGSLDELTDQDRLLWKTVLLSCLLGTAGARLNLNLESDINLLSCIGINPSMVNRIADETIILNHEQDTDRIFSIRHDRIAYEFLSTLYKGKFDNSSELMDGTLESKNTIQCFWKNININTMIDLLNNCSSIYEIERYKALVDLLTKDFVVPVHEFRYADNISKREKSELFCYGLGDFFLQKKDYRNAIAYFDAVIRDVDKEFVAAYNNKGKALNELRKYKEAVESYDQAIKLDPTFSLSYYNKGHALNDLGKNKEAVEAYDQAIKLNSNDADAYYNKGLSLYNLKKNDEAVEAYDQAIKLDPKYADAYYNKGLSLSNLNKNKEAVEAYDQAIKLKSNYADAYNNKGYALAELGLNKEAVEAYDQAIKLNAGHADAYNNKGNALGELGLNKEAVEAYDQATRLNPDDANAYNNKGYALADLGQYKEAVEAYDQATRLNPNEAVFYFNKGYALGELGLNKEAVEAYDQVIKLNPDDADAYNNKGDILYGQGMIQEAARCHKKAAELDPNTYGNK